MTTAVKRACDACHRRKVKCDGINPCRNCSSAQLSCTYNAIPQKKGPKGSRAKVISELRETQRATSLSAKVQSRLNGIHSPPCAPSLSPNTGLMSAELVKETIEFFFTHMYSTMPILNRQRLEQQAMYMDQSLDTYCLLTSMSAFMLLQPGMNVPGGDPLFEHPGANIASSQLLMEETMRVRKGYEYSESPTLNSLCTSYFLFGCSYALELHDKAWFHLREATTLAHIIGMTQEEKYMQYDGVESSRRRRLYWLLFITERAYALKNGRPVTLSATINLPSLTDDPTDPLAHQLNGYILLVNLFRSFDDTFLLLWNKTRNECSPSYLGALQKQLAGLHPPYMNGSDAQFNDMRSNQQWLKTVSWHLSLQNGVPHNGEELAYQYPLDPSRDLISITSQFQTQNTDLLGVPLVAKLLDIASALTDVLSMQPAGDPFSVGPQQHLQSLLQLLNLLRNGEHHFMPLLLSKVHDIVPRLVNPMLQRAPENVCNIDIFDGFGNAGMAQPPVMSDYKPEPFKPEAFTPAPVAQRVEDMVTDSASSNGAAPGTDINSPFPLVSSPSVMSPGMEFPQHHIGDFNSIPDMVMGSLAPSSQGSLNGQGSSMGQQNQHQQHQHQQQQQQQQHQQHQQQQQQPHHGFPAQGMTSNPNLHNQMQNGVHSQISHNMNAPQPMNNMHQQNHGHNQSFSQMGQGHMNQNMVNNMMHRQQPQRTNSMVMHQPQQIRTVGDFHALQRANSETVSMGTMAISPLGAEMDFSGLR